MPLQLYHHPLSSHCHKVLIALYELGAPFEPLHVNLGDPGERAKFFALWPTGKIPLLVDDGAAVPETTIQVEHLALRHGTKGQTLVPADPMAALEVRLMDRLADMYVMHPMQAIVADRLRPDDDRDPTSVAKARGTLRMAYDMLDQRLGGRTWLAGNDFSLADCTAAPSLFYSTTLLPFAPEHQRLAAYFERLIARPSVARVLEEAKPFFQYYPYKEALPARFL